MNQPVRARPALAIVLTSGATFMAFLDTTAVNVAFPALHSSFPTAPLSTLTWVVSSYAVFFAALLTPAGRLADVLGRRRMFLISLAVFGIASAACVAAPNLEILIAARAVQGIGAAGMIPSALSIALAETPPERRAETLGIWGAVASLAGASGPSLGGLLIEATNWRIVFLINIPITAALMVGALVALPARPVPSRQLPDVVGTLAFTLGLGLLVLGVTKGSDWEWASTATLGSLVGGALLVAVALRRSRRHPAPVIEIELWRSRTFAVANLTSLLAGGAFFTWLLCGPLFLTTIWDYSILKAGLAVTPGAIASAFTAMAVGKRAKPQHLRLIVATGMLAFLGANLWLYAALDTGERFLGLWLPANALSGAGAGATLTVLATAAATSLSPSRLAAGMGLNTTSRQVGGALGVAAMATILAGRDMTDPAGFRLVFLFASACAAVAAGACLVLLAPVTARVGGKSTADRYVGVHRKGAPADAARPGAHRRARAGVGRVGGGLPELAAVPEG